MASKGWHVFAGVRKPSDGEALQQAAAAQAPTNTNTGGSITPVIIDVTKPDTITSAAQKVHAVLSVSGQSQGLTGLVNNAGKVTLAPLEHMPIEVFEDQINVNLTGVLRVTQAFLPLMREGLQPPGSTGQADGEEEDEEDVGGPAKHPKTRRIVNISSQSGTVALPLFGGYSASKFALEAVSDCLRYELDGQGFDVVCLKPGAVKSDIWSRAHVASSSVLDALPPSVKATYGALIEQVDRAAKKAEANGAECGEVADLIATALTVDRPRARYLLGKSATLQMVVRRLLPDRWWDPLLLRGLRKQ